MNFPKRWHSLAGIRIVLCRILTLIEPWGQLTGIGSAKSREGVTGDENLSIIMACINGFMFIAGYIEGQLVEKR